MYVHGFSYYVNVRKCYLVFFKLGLGILVIVLDSIISLLDLVLELMRCFLKKIEMFLVLDF